MDAKKTVDKNIPIQVQQSSVNGRILTSVWLGFGSDVPSRDCELAFLFIGSARVDAR
jgi:hypothetical protein